MKNLPQKSKKIIKKKNWEVVIPFVNKVTKFQSNAITLTSIFGKKKFFSGQKRPEHHMINQSLNVFKLKQHVVPSEDATEISLRFYIVFSSYCTSSVKPNIIWNSVCVK